MEAYLVRGEGRTQVEQTGAEAGAPSPTTTRNEETTPNVGQRKQPPKRRGSVAVEYFKYVEGSERSYLCTICEENRPNNPKNIIMRQEDASTNTFWRHLRAIHRPKYLSLRGEHDGQTRITDTLGEDDGGSSVRRRPPFTGRTEEETKNCITRYICATDIPFRTVDHVRFKEMWQYNAQLEVDPPSSKTIRQWTGVMFEKMKEEVKDLFVNVRRVALTADVWTADNGIGLLGVTIHWIDAKWCYRERMLGLRDLGGKHDGESMAEELVRITDEFGITSKLQAITTDNASSMYKMLKVLAKMIKGVNPQFTKRRHMPCAAHILNLVVQSAMKTLKIPSAGPVDVPEGEPPIDVDTDDDLFFSDDEGEGGDVSTPERLSLGTAVSKLRTLVGAIRNTEKRRLQYYSHCEERIKRNEITDKRMLILDCPTRWNSTYEMLELALTKRDIIDVMSLTCPTNGKITKMLKEEWELLARFSRLLDRFNGTSKHFAQSRNQTISDVLYLLQGLSEHLDEAMTWTWDAPVAVGSKQQRAHEEIMLLDSAIIEMKNKLEKYLRALYSNKAIIAAAIMDPYHKGDMLDQATKAKGVTFIRKLLPPATNDSPSASTQPQVSDASTESWIHLRTKKKTLPTGRRTPMQELTDYLAGVLNDDYQASPLNWWSSTGKALYPQLAEVARDLLSVSPTSAPSERLFSAGNAVVSYRRNRLKATTIEALVSVRCWLAADNKRWYDVALEDLNNDD